MQHIDGLSPRRRGGRSGSAAQILRKIYGTTIALLLSSGACQDAASGAGAALPAEWRPFSADSPWNLRLPQGSRVEQPLPEAALAVAPFAVSDGEYGIHLFAAAASDPQWELSFGDYNAHDDNFDPPEPLLVRAPVQLVSPSGSDGTVLVVDAERALGYELWQLKVQHRGPRPAARASSISVVDLRGTGVHRNVGVTGSGLPGLGGLLRRSDVQGASSVPIRHKLWLAVHPELLYAQAVWPASRFDVPQSGRSAVLRYGDVVALSQSYSLTDGECALSPALLPVARALQDFGGIVQDRGGDSIGIVSEVGALGDVLDVSQEAYWSALACLKKHLVKVADPWTGAIPG